ncbi:MAG: DUF2203 family protein [bacterium]|nr:DUF2203 family protein [bacterium]
MEFRLLTSTYIFNDLFDSLRLVFILPVDENPTHDDADLYLGGGMTKDYFTYDEVNELIPQLEYHFQKLLHHKKEMAQASHRLRTYGATPQLIGHVAKDAPAEVHHAQGEVRRHYREYKNHLFAIENMGGEIKDLELGRVDFPAQQEGEDAVLTWQLGVTEGPFLQILEEKNEEETTTVRLEVSSEYSL